MPGGDASGMGWISEWPNVFNETPDPNCPIIGCSVKDSTCGAAAPANPQVTFGTFPSLSVDVDNSNPMGLVYNFCYLCTMDPVTPDTATNLNLIRFLYINQAALDCSSSLVINTAFVNPPANIDYNGAGLEVTIASTYQDLFVHT